MSSERGSTSVNGGILQRRQAAANGVGPSERNGVLVNGNGRTRDVDVREANRNPVARLKLLLVRPLSHWVHRGT